MFREDQYVSKADRLAYREFEGEAFILTPEDSTLHCLNETGARIWQLIDGLKTVRDMVDAIYEEYEIERDKAIEEVVRFLEKLHERNMVVVSNEPSEELGSHGRTISD